MFDDTADDLLQDLDDWLGDRSATCEVLALASATVLTAAHHDAPHHWLDDVQRRMHAPCPPVSQIIVSTGFKRTTFRRRRIEDAESAGLPSSVPKNAADRLDQHRAALRHLLDTLETKHDGQVPDILRELARLAAQALAPLSSSHRQEWTALLLGTHKSVQCGYLKNHSDLN